MRFLSIINIHYVNADSAMTRQDKNKIRDVQKRIDAKENENIYFSPLLCGIWFPSPSNGEDRLLQYHMEKAC